MTVNKDKSQVLLSILSACPESVDLSDEEHAGIITETVDSLIEAGIQITEIENLENQLIDRKDPSPVFILLVLKIAKSRLLAASVKNPLKITIVFAVYKEHNRIRKKSEHPHGENFLVSKYEQLSWLFNGLLHIDWELIVVDDGCPENSGKIAQGIVDRYKLNNRIRVLFLAEAIRENYPPAQMLSSTDESRKGGSIAYGMWDALQKNSSNKHIVAYTDADLSTHLGQLMLLVDPILSQDKEVAIGSRREASSVVVKKGTRNNRGKLFIYLWKRLIPNLGDIIDTQCGFKAFRADVAVRLIENLIEQKFAFDIELLLKAELIKRNSILKVPVAWIDSEQESTTTDLQPYLSMLNAIVKMSRQYFPEKSESNEFASFIESLTEADFAALLTNIPQDIAQREPSEFTKYDRLSAEVLANAVKDALE